MYVSDTRCAVNGMVVLEAGGTVIFNSCSDDGQRYDLCTPTTPHQPTHTITVLYCKNTVLTRRVDNIVIGSRLAKLQVAATIRTGTD